MSHTSLLPYLKTQARRTGLHYEGLYQNKCGIFIQYILDYTKALFLKK